MSNQEPKTVKEVLQQLAGAASLCWTKTPKGIFDSSKALKFCDQAISDLERIIVPERYNGTGDISHANGYNQAIEDMKARIR